MERNVVCWNWREPWWWGWGNVVSIWSLEQLVQTLKNERHWHGTNKVGHVENLSRNKELGHEHMFKKKIAPSPIYMVKNFSTVNIGQVVNFLWKYCKLFIFMIIFLQIRDCIRKPWVVFNPEMHGCTSHPFIITRVDAINVCYHLSRVRQWKAWSNLCTCGVTAIFQPIYLWKPLKEKIENQLKINANKGFFYVCSQVLIICIKCGRIAKLHGKGNFKTKMKRGP